jgi:hypothetical protein
MTGTNDQRYTGTSFLNVFGKKLPAILQMRGEG